MAALTIGVSLNLMNSAKTKAVAMTPKDARIARVTPKGSAHDRKWISFRKQLVWLPRDQESLGHLAHTLASREAG